MKMNTLMIIGAVVLVVVLIGVAIFLPGRAAKPFKENLYGVDYSMEGHETKIEGVESSKPLVAMHIEDYGSIIVELYPEYAPNTVNNFLSLVMSGFYDNNTFHRLSKGFVLQGGDPTGTGGGDPGYSIKGEFISNGVNNTLKHERGILSMARTSEPDSAGSQFFVVLGSASHLDNEYAAFGKVIKGMDIIEAIEKREAVNGDILVTNLTIKKSVYDLNGYNYQEPKKIS